MSAGLALPLVGWIAVAVTLGLTVMVAADPQGGLARLDHRPELLGQVMAGRYAAQALLAFAAAVTAHAGFLLALLLSFALASFVDALVHARAGHRHRPHTVAGIASLAGAALLLTAQH
ncbi:hypothetical protein GI374_09120 [Paracoccus sp. S-4012]|uniref:hypothetical protein n=1 Tax=Paracoccus sp. S-4012 TaxID=2665648 RepID=UPI0012AF7EA4|nr:hypothetical protein [Paracoccus sp. S-4012]MRX50603.1 hypothetical protein [Paracoccus sp. S-4012]